MSLKRNFQSLDTFSMSSMTDVIFLLLIFFMVTSTIIFPSAIDVNLPQSSEQTSDKPTTEVYIDADNRYYIVVDRNDSINVENTSPREISLETLAVELTNIHQADSLRGVALYADSLVDYGKVVDILDMAARNNIRMVLATKARSMQNKQADK
ncbi:MAG: biopolymer transporter ExbD [Muribaculaceae bacterium]|nr:biopolymer transporter ExbD [Muribaculaceae bacterium]